jgi:hypothetical protein
MGALGFGGEHSAHLDEILFGFGVRIREGGSSGGETGAQVLFGLLC